jgi:hypothetical protein
MRGQRGASMRFSVKGTIPATDGRTNGVEGWRGRRGCGRVGREKSSGVRINGGHCLAFD